MMGHDFGHGGGGGGRWGDMTSVFVVLLELQKVTTTKN